MPQAADSSPAPRPARWAPAGRCSPWRWRCSAALLWAGWYVYNRGFSRKWREQLAAELRRRGLDFTATRLTLNPFEGLVAEDAHLYLLDAHHTPLLYINRVAVDISVCQPHPEETLPQFARPARRAPDPARGHGRSRRARSCSSCAASRPSSPSCPARCG